MLKSKVNSWFTMISVQYTYEGERTLKEIMDRVGESYKKGSFVFENPETSFITEDGLRSYVYDVAKDNFTYRNTVTDSMYVGHYPFTDAEWNDINMLIKSEKPKL